MYLQVSIFVLSVFACQMSVIKTHTTKALDNGIVREKLSLTRHPLRELFNVASSTQPLAFAINLFRTG